MSGLGDRMDSSCRTPDNHKSGWENKSFSHAEYGSSMVICWDLKACYIFYFIICINLNRVFHKGDILWIYLLCNIKSSSHSCLPKLDPDLSFLELRLIVNSIKFEGVHYPEGYSAISCFNTRERLANGPYYLICTRFPICY